jgi:hypothetical protein
MRHYVATTASFLDAAEPERYLPGYFSISAPNASWSFGTLMENSGDYRGYL